MVCSHYYYRRQSQQTTIFPETAQESGGSCPTTSAFYATVIRPVLEYCAPVWHYVITRLQTEHLESIQKRAIHIIYPFTRGMSYSNILFVAELTSLESRRDQLSRSFFQDISHPSSSLYHLLPPPRDTSALSRLRTATRFTRPISRTKKYCSFINYALNHYQVPPRNN